MTNTDTGVHNIKTEDDFKTAIGAPGLAVFDFYATWCGPCKVVAPKVVELSNTYTDAKFYKIDVDELSKLAAELGIRAMPTFQVYKDGEKVEEIVGANVKAIEAAVTKGLNG